MQARTSFLGRVDHVWTPLLGAILLASLLAPPQRSDDLEAVRTRRLSIVNDAGETVVEIFGDERGGGLSLRSTRLKVVPALQRNKQGREQHDAEERRPGVIESSAGSRSLFHRNHS